MNFTCNVVYIQISEGDIFKDGPSADAIVSKMTLHSALFITCMLHRCRQLIVSDLWMVELIWRTPCILAGKCMLYTYNYYSMI